MLITRFMISAVVTTLVLASTLVVMAFPTVDYSATQILARVLLLLLTLTIGTIQGLLITMRYPLGSKRHAVGAICYVVSVMIAICLLTLDLGTSYNFSATKFAAICAWVLLIIGNFLNK